MNQRHGRRPGPWLVAMLLIPGGALASVACGAESSSPDSSRIAPTAEMQSASPVSVDAVDLTENPLGRQCSWGESREITDLYARVERPIERPEAPTQAGGMKMVVVEVTLENESGGRRRYAAETFTAFDQEGRDYGPSRSTSEVLSSGRLGPGQAVWGLLAFEVPTDATIERVVWTFPAFEWVNEWTWQ